MPSISTHMHFGKVLLDKSDIEVDMLSYVFGLISPKTIVDVIDEYHTLDEDGNIDVREFYEKFNTEDLPLEAKSFVLGYYSSLWFEEYYKFNANKLIIHNKKDLSDTELEKALEDTVKYYDLVSIGGYYNKLKDTIAGYTFNLLLNETNYIDITKVKELIVKYFEEKQPHNTHTELIDENEYNNFIDVGCTKFIKSL